MNSYDVIVGAVNDYWKVNYPQDVVVFFQQKYSWDDKWEKCEELVECNGIDDYENMTFLSDFCEGQTEVKDVVIIPLREVTAFYYKKKIENHESKPITNTMKIRAMTDEELADYINSVEAEAIKRAGRYLTKTEIERGKAQRLDWLRQEALP